MSIDDLVNIFLSWPLPDSVCCDSCATEKGYKHYRSGTNLLTATEARQMFEYVLAKADALPGERMAELERKVARLESLLTQNTYGALPLHVQRAMSTVGDVGTGSC